MPERSSKHVWHTGIVHITMHVARQLCHSAGFQSVTSQDNRINNSWWQIKTLFIHQDKHFDVVCHIKEHIRNIKGKRLSGVPAPWKIIYTLFYFPTVFCNAGVYRILNTDILLIKVISHNCYYTSQRLDFTWGGQSAYGWCKWDLLHTVCPGNLLEDHEEATSLWQMQGPSTMGQT